MIALGHHRYVTIKDSKQVKINSVDSLYLTFSKVNGYFEKIDKNKYLTLVRIYESKEIIKKYEELWSKIRNLIRSMTKSSDEYDEKYMKIKFDSDDLFRITYFGYLQINLQKFLT